MLTQEFSLGACQRGELLGIDRALFVAAKARFPETELMSVIAHSDYSRPRYREDNNGYFSSAVYQTSVEEIKRLARKRNSYEYYDSEEVDDDVGDGVDKSSSMRQFRDVPFLRANNWNGTELLVESNFNPHYGNEGSEMIGECMYLHAALIIPTWVDNKVERRKDCGRRHREAGEEREEGNE